MAVLIAAYLPACLGWHDRASLAPAPLSNDAEFLRLTLQNGQRVKLHHARIVGDSVIGQTGFGVYQARGAVALQDVRRMEDRQFKAGSSVFAVLGVLLVVGLVAAASAIHTGFGGS